MIIPSEAPAAAGAQGSHYVQEAKRLLAGGTPYRTPDHYLAAAQVQALLAVAYEIGKLRRDIQSTNDNHDKEGMGR